MNMHTGWLYVIILFITFAIFSCEKEDPLDEQDPDQVDLPDDIPEASDANKFVFNSLAIYYYWVDKVAGLTDSKLNNKDYYNFYLNKFTDPFDLFTSHLYEYEVIDEWSKLFENHNDIDNWLAGISETTGIVPGKIILDNEGNCAALVIYVLNDSPAAREGIKRGDVIMKVDGTGLTDNNYYDLLFNKLTSTYHMGEITQYGIYDNGIKYTVTGEIIQENPVFLDSIYNVDGYKVGYLVYHGFTSAYDTKLGTSYDLLLNDVFKKFKNAGIDKLILDLRYNTGGSVNSASYLASMIYSTDTTRLFAKTQFNDLIQSEIIKAYGEKYLKYNLEYYIDSVSWKINDENGTYLRTVKTPKTPVTSLNINDIYVLTTNNSVSASELLINGLKAYGINLKCVGTTTRGKFVGSWTLKDYIDADNTTLNPNHTLGMQLIVSKIVNSLGEADYVNGIPPDIEVNEDLLNFLPFGDTNDPLLRAALDDIKGIIAAKSAKKPLLPLEPFNITKGLPHLSDEMYLDPVKMNKIKQHLILPAPNPVPR
jgi:carboxyl-terminal processing protease